MLNRINQLFQDSPKNLLSIYFCAGCPTLDGTADVIRALERNGVSMIEIGIPFSDPMADGIVIQNAATRALHNGMSLRLLFEQLRDIRRDVRIPLVLMGYLNPIMQFGFEAFCQKCVECGIDGVIIPDLPFRDYEESYKAIASKYDIRVIMLITPETSEARVREIDAHTDGFIYLVSSAATTGAQKDFDTRKQAYFKKIEDMNLRNPRMVGFGISNKQTFDAACAHSSGAIIGSRFVTLLNEKEGDAEKAIRQMKEDLKQLAYSNFIQYIFRNEIIKETKSAKTCLFYFLPISYFTIFVPEKSSNTNIMKVDCPSVLLIYTGGTIGMIENPETGALENFNFDQLLQHVPELKRFNYRISSYQFDPPIDSSDMEPSLWAKIVKIINYNYDNFDGFVILHGTDTMAYTASALSFMLENLSKPVILTGSQLPIGTLRTDGKENLITAIEIAAAKHPDGTPIVPEVCIFFENELMRGNRTTKINAENFNAFRSFNYPALAKAGIHIRYNEHLIHRPDPSRPMKPHYLFDTNVVVLTLFPGIQESIINSVLHVPGLKAVVLKTFGSGNAPQKEWFIRQLKEASERGIVIVNITQCQSGAVEMGRYETGLQLLQAGVISGYDSTPECAVTKLMFLLGHGLDQAEIRHRMNSDLAGEITKI